MACGTTTTPPVKHAPPAVALPSVAPPPPVAAAPIDPTPGKPEAPACCEALGPFYERFRAAALATDVAAAAELTRFPLEIRGGLDDSPSLSLTRAQFGDYFRKLLDADTEQSVPPMTAREAFDDAEMPDPQFIADESFYVGNFRFEKDEGRWRLAAVYSDAIVEEAETLQSGEK